VFDLGAMESYGDDTCRTIITGAVHKYLHRPVPIPSLEDATASAKYETERKWDSECLDSFGVSGTVACESGKEHGMRLFKPDGRDDGFCRWESVIPHGLLASTLYAWNHHCPLRLKPVVLWSSILQIVSGAIAYDSKSDRDRDPGGQPFLNLAGRLLKKTKGEDGSKLSIELDVDFPDWSNKLFCRELVRRFSSRLAGLFHEGVFRKIVPEFSNLDPDLRMALGIAVMDCAKGYVDYRCFTKCALTKLELEGTCEDWRLLVQGVEDLKGVLGPDFCRLYVVQLTALQDTLARLYRIRCSGPEARDSEWLQSIVTHTQHSSRNDITGWVLDFVWFTHDLKLIPPDKTGGPRRLEVKAVPVGYCVVPFAHVNLKTGMKTQLHFISGAWDMYVLNHDAGRGRGPGSGAGSGSGSGAGSGAGAGSSGPGSGSDDDEWWGTKNYAITTSVHWKCVKGEEVKL
jgi:hypothetical protein